MLVLDAGLQAVMDADSALIALIGTDADNNKKTYQGKAPQGVVPPYLIWQEVTDVPGYAFGNTLKYDHAFYMFRAFAVDANTSGPAQTGAIADRLKSLLTNPTLTVTGQTVLSARFDRSYPPLEEFDAANNRHIWGRGVLIEVWVAPI